MNYPVTPLEPAISRQRLFRIARERLAKKLNLESIEDLDINSDSEDEQAHQESKEDHDAETTTGSSSLSEYANRYHPLPNGNGYRAPSGRSTTPDRDDASVYSRRSNGTDTSSLYDEEDEEEEEEEEEEDGTVQMELERLNIVFIPNDIVELFRKRVSKLSLKSNWLTSLPLTFKDMKQLFYLDISGNRFEEFPEVLCQCPNLVILDISNNQISSLPSDIGNLVNLRCLSIKNNRFEYLPPSIADMADLELLEVDNNPLILPPRAAMKDPSSPTWLSDVKHYLSSNRDHITSMIEKKQQQQQQLQLQRAVLLDGEGSNGSVWKSPSPQPPSDFKLQLPRHKSKLSTATTSSSQSGSRSASTSSTTSQAATTANTTAVSPSQTPEVFDPAGLPVDRLRSGSESHGSSSRAAKRMGFIVKKQQQQQQEQQQQQSQPQQPQQPQQLGDSPEPQPKPDAKELEPTLARASHSRNISYESFGERSDSDFEIPSGATTPITSKSKHLLNKSGLYSSSPVLESVSGAYFRRLSTLNEHMVRSHSQRFEVQSKVVESCRKVLFSLGELNGIMRRCAAFCDDKSLTTKLLGLLRTSKNAFPVLVGALENLEANSEKEDTAAAGAEPSSSDLNAVINASVQCLAAFRNVTAFFRANLELLMSYVDIKFIRALILTCFQSFNELQNAWFTLYPTRTISRQLSRQVAGATAGSPMIDDALRTGEGLSAADDQLYDRIYSAANAAQAVLGQLTEAVSKSASASVASSIGGSGAGISPTVALKVRDLTSTCVTGVEVTRRLKQRMEIIRNTGQIDRRLFWEDLNAFLKAIILIMRSAKSVMPDLPVLNDARPNLTTLTRLAKEIPVLLEYSSYKIMYSEGSNAFNAYNPSPVQSAPPPTTPLVAVLGPTAAQAVVLSPSTHTTGYSSPFIPDSTSTSPSEKI
ncbi:hypothetical protein TRVA0_045S00342 [Trichomonascus vanleenenianus]|uniref:uncharacterized protein n=1 Tax=Trichomonascus vanleenenianus TaxID=2268995 RepID=UPI003ECAF7EA